jgi:hypothetical protein
VKNQDHHPSHKNTVVSLVSFTEGSVVEVIGAGAPVINPEEVKLCLISSTTGPTLNSCVQRFHTHFMCTKI